MVQEKKEEKDGELIPAFPAFLLLFHTFSSQFVIIIIIMAAFRVNKHIDTHTYIDKYKL